MNDDELNSLSRTLARYREAAELWKRRHDEMVATCAHTGKQRNEAIRILRTLKGDLDHLGHWIPEPCREMVESFLLENVNVLAPAGEKTPTKP